MNVIKLFALAGVLLLSACSTITTDKSDSDLLIEDESGNKAEAIHHEEEVVAISIEPDVLYMLLVAEVAGQRKQYDIAMEGYLRAAKRIDDSRISERAAKIALYLKDKQRTDDAVAIWLQQQPDNMDARKIALLSSLRDEDDEAALIHLSYLIEHDPAGFDATLFEVAKLMQAEKKGDFTFQLLDDLSALYPEQASIPYVQAVISAQSGNYFTAREKIAEALRLQPDWSKALLFQAQLAAMHANADEAKNIIAASLEKDPENVALKKLLANSMIKSGLLQQAADVFEEILQEDPADEEAKYGLALVYLQLPDYDKAELHLLDLAASQRYRMQANLYLGRLQFIKGQVEDGLVWYDRVTEEPLQYEAVLLSISSLINAQMYERALQRLQVKRKDYPTKQQRFVLLEAEIYSKRKQYQKAFDLLTVALQESPDSSEILYTRALLAERMGNLDVLEADLLKILEKNPNDVNALNALGYTLADKTDRYEEAEAYLSKALKLDPNQAIIQDSYGWLLFKQGKHEKALQYLQKAYDGVKEGEIAAHLAEVLWVMGRKDEAVALFRRAMQESSDVEPLKALQLRVPQIQ